MLVIMITHQSLFESFPRCAEAAHQFVLLFCVCLSEPSSLTLFRCLTELCCCFAHAKAFNCLVLSLVCLDVVFCLCCLCVCVAVLVF